jgi:hypothetical protein
MDTQPHEPETPDDDAQLPEALRRELAAMYGQRVDVPHTVDDAVLLETRRRLGRNGSRPGVLRRIGPWALPGAVAAAVGLVAWLGTMPFRGGSQSAVPPVAADIDRSGRVNILDAFALARRIDRREPLEPRWDVNGDGAIDRADVDAIGQKAVELPDQLPGTGAEGRL